MIGPDWKKLRELLPFVDVFCPNSQEAEAITGESKPEAAAEVLLENGVRQFVAIKNGERGGRRIRKLGTSDGSTQTANRESHLNTDPIVGLG